MAGWGAGVLAIGYPGYGGNSGSPSESAIHAAAKAAYDWLRAQGYAPHAIIIYGHSMGSGVAVKLAADNPAGGLILESPFTSMAATAQRIMPIFPVKWLIRDRFDSLSRIGAVRMPVGWIHGDADGLIPIDMGQTLFDAVKAPKCFETVRGGDHDNLWGRGTSAFVRKQAFAMVTTGMCE